MRTIFVIMSIFCIFITCYCYELNQEDRTDKSRDIIGCIGSFTFIMGMLFMAIAFGK